MLKLEILKGQILAEVIVNRDPLEQNTVTDHAGGEGTAMEE